MKSSRRYLSLLFALAMSLNLFSATVHAESVSDHRYKLHVVATEMAMGDFGQDVLYEGENQQFIYDIFTEFRESVLYSFRNKLTFTDESDYILFEAGKEVDFRVDNLFFQVDVIAELDDTQSEHVHSIYIPQYIAQAYMVYTDGTTQALSADSYSLVINKSTNCYSILVNCKPTKDVAKLFVQVNSDWDIRRSDKYYYENSWFVMHFGTYPDDRGLVLDISVETKEQGLLKGLLGKLTDVWNTLESGFANLVKGITELPQKLWNLIETGLKNLFVPSEEDMAAYKDKWEQLLSSRLGAVYEVGQIMTESWDGVMAADQTNTIDFPSASINLPGGNSFTFGGYNVQVVPSGFDVLTTAIKTIVAIVCTIAFVNGMRKRYDEVMGVNQ